MWVAVNCATTNKNYYMTATFTVSKIKNADGNTLQQNVSLRVSDINTCNTINNPRSGKPHLCPFFTSARFSSGSRRTQVTALPAAAIP